MNFFGNFVILILILKTYLIFLGFFANAESNENPECNTVERKSPSLRLKRHLFCQYDKTIRPIIGKEGTINVNVSMSLKYLDFVSLRLKLKLFNN